MKNLLVLAMAFGAMACLSVVITSNSFVAAQENQSGDAGDERVERIAELIERLDSKRFSERQASEQELLRLGPAATAQMCQAIEAAKGEAKIRLQRILTELSRSIRIVEKIPSKSLENVTSVSISADGRFLYAAAFAANSLSVYAIDAENGKLTPVETHTDENDLQGAVSIRLCNTAPLAVAACFSGKTITLLSRDEESGKLKQVDVYRGDARRPTPSFPIEAVFSPDGKFVYALDAYVYAAVEGESAIAVFRRDR